MMKTDNAPDLSAAIAVETKPVAWVTEPSGLQVATIQHDDYSLIEISKPRCGGFELTIHRGNEESARWDDLSIALTAAEAAKLASAFASPQPLLDAPRVSDLIKRLVIPMVEQRSREKGDAWDQAAQELIALSALQSDGAGK